MYAERDPEVSELITALAAYRLRYVVVGSVAAALYGVETQPRDLDITPALGYHNLLRLKASLKHLRARPNGAVGRWEVQPDGELKWLRDALTPEETEAFRRGWRLEPDDPKSVDHLFTTRCGNLDVVPELVGSYDYLLERAVPLQAYGHEVWVAHVDDLLSTLTVPRRKKDRARVARLREVQHGRGRKTI